MCVFWVRMVDSSLFRDSFCSLTVDSRRDTRVEYENGFKYDRNERQCVGCSGSWGITQADWTSRRGVCSLIS